MNKKLYIYPNASHHDQDTIEEYKDTVPLSEAGIKKHFTVVDTPENADYFYIGQISNASTVPLYESTGEEFPFFNGNEKLHIADMEGEGGWDIPDWLQKCILTTMGPRKSVDVYKLFTRPAFSKMFVEMIKDKRTFNFPEKNGFGFRGCINHEVRNLMFRALNLPILNEKRIRREAYINGGYAGSAPANHPIHKIYEELMLKHPLSLCPRGAGIASTRILETCFYSRVPVIIVEDDFWQVGEDEYDMSFCFKILVNNSPEELANELINIYNTDIEELKERGMEARKYFDTVVRPYMDDPTLYFLKWLERNK